VPFLQAFNQECTQSRRKAGVHFQGAINASRLLCPGIGQSVFAKISQLGLRQ
jgi:hypothetical protein